MCWNVHLLCIYLFRQFLVIIVWFKNIVYINYGLFFNPCHINLMYTWVYICMHLYVHTLAILNTVSLCLCIRVLVSMSVCMCIFVYMCDLYVCLFIFMYVYVYLCVCMCAQKHSTVIQKSVCLVKQFILFYKIFTWCVLFELEKDIFTGV